MGLAEFSESGLPNIGKPIAVNVIGCVIGLFDPALCKHVGIGFLADPGEVIGTFDIAKAKTAKDFHFSIGWPRHYRRSRKIVRIASGRDCFGSGCLPIHSSSLASSSGANRTLIGVDPTLGLPRFDFLAPDIDITNCWCQKLRADARIRPLASALIINALHGGFND